MKNFLFKLRVLAEFIIAIMCFYAAIVYVFPTMVFNLILVVISLFIFAEALGNIDKINGYNIDKPETGFPENDNHHAGFPENNHHAGFPEENDDDFKKHSPQHHEPRHMPPDVDFIVDDELRLSQSDDTTNYNNDYPEIPE